MLIQLPFPGIHQRRQNTYHAFRHFFGRISNIGAQRHDGSPGFSPSDVPSSELRDCAETLGDKIPRQSYPWLPRTDDAALIPSNLDSTLFLALDFTVLSYVVYPQSYYTPDLCSIPIYRPLAGCLSPYLLELVRFLGPARAQNGGYLIPFYSHVLV